MAYYKNAEEDLFVDPIVENHEGLAEITEHEFNELLAVKSRLEITQEQAEAHTRSHRNRLLAETDWVVAVAYERGEPVAQGWIDYRQALRDITMQPGFPNEVVWPTKPE